MAKKNFLDANFLSLRRIFGKNALKNSSIKIVWPPPRFQNWPNFSLKYAKKIFLRLRRKVFSVIFPKYSLKYDKYDIGYEKPHKILRNR